jgi:hypothetical protein
MSQRLASFPRCILMSRSTLLLLTLLPLLLGPAAAIAEATSTADSGCGGAHAELSTHPGSFLVDYTGALFGYYRVEPDQPNFGELGPPKCFLSYKHEKSLLLGMGDNFAPEFGASVARELRNPCHPLAIQKRSLVPPELLYKNEDWLPPMAECDNVGRFLMKAGYSVIVPGKEDFLYSARWLRRMALLFRGASDSSKQNQAFPDNQGNTLSSGSVQIANPDHKLFMLAANLRLNFKAVGLDPGHRVGIDKQDLAKDVKGACPLFFSWDPLPSARRENGNAVRETELVRCISGGDNGDTVTEEMDWLRRLDLTIEQERNCVPDKGTYDDCIPIASAMNLRAAKEPGFRRQLLVNQGQIAISAVWIDPEVPEDVRKRLLHLYEVANKDAKSLEKPEPGKPDYSKPDSDISKVYSESADAAKDLLDLVQAHPLDPKYRAYLELTQDLEMLFRDLHKRFALWDQPWFPPTADRSYLLSPEARKAGVRLLLRKIAAEQKDVGYTIAAGNGSVPGTLVIGVMGQEAMKAVSPANLLICSMGMAASQYASTRKLGSCDNTLEEKGRDDTGADVAPESATARLEGRVQVGDPVLAVTTLVRAAWMMKDVGPFYKVVVMAQMPRTEAEELAARVLSSLRMTANCADLPTAERKCGNYEWTADLPHVDLIISEAQTGGHTSGDMKLRYAPDSVIPVVAPRPAWYIKNDESGLVPPISTVSVDPTRSGDKLVLRNEIVADDSNPDPNCQANPQHSCLKTMAQLLFEELREQRNSRDLANLQHFWNRCDEQKACQDSATTQFLLTQIQRDSHADDGAGHLGMHVAQQ